MSFSSLGKLPGRLYFWFSFRLLFENNPNLSLLPPQTKFLVPKKEAAISPSCCRPFSLIHSCVKIIIKVLASCLKPFMDLLADEAQTTYIKGRSINYCVRMRLFFRIESAKLRALFVSLILLKLLINLILATFPSFSNLGVCLITGSNGCKILSSPLKLLCPSMVIWEVGSIVSVGFDRTIPSHHISSFLLLIP